MASVYGSTTVAKCDGLMHYDKISHYLPLRIEIKEDGKLINLI